MNVREFEPNRFLVGLIGIDHRLLLLTPEETQARFFWASRFVILIMGLTFVSVLYAFVLMFHMWPVALLLSLFITAMFGTIYVLLIQTFSKQPLGARTRGFHINWSNVTRGGFILFIGFLISKPLEILVFSNSLERDVEQYKTALKNDFAKKSAQLFEKDLRMLQSEGLRADAIGSSRGKSVAIDKITELDNKKTMLVDDAAAKIESSDFFLRRIQVVTRQYPLSRLICFLVILLFTLPVAMIYSISTGSRYYTLKRSNDQDLVLRHYHHFSKLYASVFARKYGLTRTFYESHTDPPFRTERIPPRFFDTQDEYFKSLEP